MGRALQCPVYDERMRLARRSAERPSQRAPARTGLSHHQGKAMEASGDTETRTTHTGILSTTPERKRWSN